MAQPLKELINAGSVGVLADGIAAVWAPFARAAFVRSALAGLAGLELKDRVRHVARALHEALPLPFPDAAKVLRESAGQVRLDLWSGWPATEHVGTHGVEHLDESMATLAVLTPHSTGEFAVRPLLERHQMDALKIMYRWADSPNEHLRRLASEGTRPRLPWGSRVRWLMEPGPAIPILDALRDDPSEYVRRSVANHVNDIAKDHPETAIDLLGRWRDQGGSHVERVLRHASRGLIKAGHPRALTLMGALPGSGTVNDLTLAEDQVAIGDHLRFTVTLTADHPGPLVLKYAIRRDASHRVYHLAERPTAKPGQPITVTKSHSFRPVTTRNEPPGPRTLEIIINGAVRATAPFLLKSTTPA
ncbi:DNA alkylation repair protein [Acrocarpospora macrocephala]|uniref:DNA alkylation repair protein n=1 Tax=Acrocarpospora macrocephala TaxID=150177 RepID=UPI0012D35E8E|nr:DNA alkylation repair protein [Acrocarpospora macrocephala]